MDIWCCFARTTLDECKASVLLRSRLLSPNSSINCIHPHQLQRHSVITKGIVWKIPLVKQLRCSSSRPCTRDRCTAWIQDFSKPGDPDALEALSGCQHLRGLLPLFPHTTVSMAGLFHPLPLQSSSLYSPSQGDVADFNLSSEAQCRAVLKWCWLKDTSRKTRNKASNKVITLLANIHPEFKVRAGYPLQQFWWRTFSYLKQTALGNW